MIHFNLLILQFFELSHVPLAISVGLNEVLDGFLLFGTYFDEFALVLLVNIRDERAYRHAGIRVLRASSWFHVVIRLLALGVSALIHSISVALLVRALGHRQEFRVSGRHVWIEII